MPLIENERKYMKWQSSICLCGYSQNVQFRVPKEFPFYKVLPQSCVVFSSSEIREHGPYQANGQFEAELLLLYQLESPWQTQTGTFVQQILS